MKNLRVVWMLCFVLPCLGLGLGLGLVGCGDDDPKADPVSWDITLIDYTSDDPMVGAEVCVAIPDNGDCVTTDANGNAALTTLPGKARTGISFTAPGFASALWLYQTGTEDLGHWEGVMVDNTLLDIQFGLVDLDIDPTAGHFGMYIGDEDGAETNTLEGVSIAISPAAGTPAFYNDASGIPDETLTETSTSGGAAIVNIPPGDYTVTLTGLPSGCHTNIGWGDTPETQPIIIRRGLSTYISVHCQ